MVLVECLVLHLVHSGPQSRTTKVAQARYDPTGAFCGSPTGDTTLEADQQAGLVSTRWSGGIATDVVRGRAACEPTSVLHLYPCQVCADGMGHI